MAYNSMERNSRRQDTPEPPQNVIQYRSNIAPRNIIIQRTSSYMGSGSGAPGHVITRERSSQLGMLAAAAPPGAYTSITASGVSNVKESREREKKDMQDLNERFASYIEKVRFLEAQNRRLADELDKLKGKWGKETTQIKAMYQVELDEARKLYDDALRDKARLELQIASLEEQLQELSQRYDAAKQEAAEQREKQERQNQQLSDLEAEVSLLRRRVEGCDGDRAKDKKFIAQLQETLNRVRIDLDNETLLHIDAENRRQTMEEELEFVKAMHDQDMKELAALAYRDTTSENREYWKNELGQALREIQQVYDDKAEAMRGELESFYNLKVQEFRTGSTKQNMETIHSKEETKRLRTQLADVRDKLNELETRNGQLQRELNTLRREKEERERELEEENSELKSASAKHQAELEAVLQELQKIMDTKLGLELEIATYRKLLDEEERRANLVSAIDSWENSFNEKDGTAPMSPSKQTPQKGEMSARTTYQKSAKGPISIPECAPDGKYIVLENTGRRDEMIGNWMIKRTVEGEDRVQFQFSPNFAIKAGNRLKIWARGYKPSNAPDTDLECRDSSWGVGTDIITKLVNTYGEDRASHIQKTAYSQQHHQ